MPSRRRNQVDPLQLKPGRLRRPRAARRRQVRRDGAAHRRRRHPRVPRHRVRRRPSAASPATGSSCRPTSSTRSPATSAASSPPSTRWAAPTGTRPRAGPASYVKQIAAELIQLYSARMATAGHAFGPDTPWQRELEDAFAYVETPDQLSSIDEVKADMERSVPDGPAHLRRRRLRQDRDRRPGGLQGDPGRQAGRGARADDAAGPAAPADLHRALRRSSRSSCKAAVPVPERQGGPRGHRRARRRQGRPRHRHPPPAVRATIRYKDLGLVVVDEEQRFGVEHKEQLKTLRTAVDVLAMSATPIPRTLEMAVTGIREMSTLATPPEERHPVLTYVGAYDEKQITRPSGASCCARARSSSSTTRSARIERAACPHPRAGARGPGRHRPRPDGRAQAGAGRPRLLGQEVRRARLHHDRRDRPGHLQRQHPDRRAGRRPRPVPAAPAPRSGRPRPRAGLLLLPLPAREADDRDGARPAADDGQPHRPRRPASRSR